MVDVVGDQNAADLNDVLDRTSGTDHSNGGGVSNMPLSASQTILRTFAAAAGGGAGRMNGSPFADRATASSSSNLTPTSTAAGAAHDSAAKDPRSRLVGVNLFIARGMGTNGGGQMSLQRVLDRVRLLVNQGERP